ncbi:acyl carrier protein phosphodiesterase [Leptotrichia buccalis]
MNFLAHSLISLEIDEKENKKTLYANFAGDFYKGLVETIELPDELKEGIVLHRIIDKISDRNENFLNELLTEKFGIFKGIVSDMYIDHFLSKNFDSLFNDNLNNIENKILYNIKINEKFFPDNFKRTFQWLKSEKVMSSYQNINFLERAFYGISQRVRKGEILKSSIIELQKNYNLFEEKAIKEFFYVKSESIKMFNKNRRIKKKC